MTPEHHAEAILRAAEPAAFMYSRDGTYSRIHKSQQPSRYNGWNERPLYTAEAILAAVREAVEAKWLPITDEVKDGRDVLLFYPLEGLNPDYHPQRVIGHWNAGIGAWVFQARAVRGYSPVYQPTHYQPLPTPPRGE